MVWFVIRERRRRSQIASVNFDASRMEKPSPSYVIPTFNLSEKNAPPPPFFGYPGYSEGKNIVNPSYVRDSYVRDPSYVSEKYSPTVSDYPRTSISWEYIRRNSADSRTRKVPNIDPELVDNLRTSVNTTNMLSSSNIEKMLDMAGRRRASEDAFGLHSPRSVISTDSYGFVPPSINSLPALAPAIPRRLSRHLSFGQRISPDVPRNLSFADSTFIVDRSMPLSESPESMGSRLQRPDSGAITTSSTGAMEEFTVVQPQKAVLLEAPPNPIQRSISPRTVSREDSLAKLVGAVPGGSRRTGSLGSRFSMDSLVAGGSNGQRSLENRYF
ncbi:hypothetical protein BDP27DRAFT_1311135 [Rhodocollybia butyracea]|uniref:Uncharacterized protein n=1 Tax=Rhodocollybia butyracea TaxID=206335 RepID=A0A9P5UFP5_9AGAR|nr:hypothetical protein BDP27DRAFT_1311135 [Rhodocollybia butyracea]